MSLLPCTSHANPTTPFWSTSGGGGGGGVIPQLLNSLTTENYYNLEDYTTDEFITPLGASINQSVSGNVLVTVNMNINGNGGNDKQLIPIVIEKNGDSYYYTTYARASAVSDTSYSFNISIPYISGDTDEYYYRFQVVASTDVRVNTSCSFVFYPDVV